MWTILESTDARKALRVAPLDVRKKYELWKNIVRTSGQPGLRSISGFRDEALLGSWKGFRSSRLSLQFRVIYRVVYENVEIHVAEVTPHDYRRPR